MEATYGFRSARNVCSRLQFVQTNISLCFPKVRSAGSISYSHYGRPDEIDLYPGSFDEPGLFQPSYELWASRRAKEKASDSNAGADGSEVEHAERRAQQLFAHPGHDNVREPLRGSRVWKYRNMTTLR